MFEFVQCDPIKRHWHTHTVPRAAVVANSTTIPFLDLPLSSR
jgi:hypothetical protein